MASTAVMNDPFDGVLLFLLMIRVPGGRHAGEV